MNELANEIRDFVPACPIPIQNHPQVMLSHGGGGSLMHQLIEKMFIAAFGNPILEERHDAAMFDLPSGSARLAFTTDSFVVRPLFFPGGDIGSLAVHGTVNDLAMAGARPLYLSAGFIIEEGLSMATLWQIVCSMKEAAREAGVAIVTGDTKVVDKGKGDGLYINTAGIGVREGNARIGPAAVRPGDAVIVNGDLGRHGMAIMAVREGLSFETAIESDSMPVADRVQALLKAGIEVHCLRDITRGGLATTLNEIAATARVGIKVEEPLIPVRDDVRGACEILGFDPLYVACEGRFMAFVEASDARRALGVLKRHTQAEGPALIGRVHAGPPGQVTIKTQIGGERILDMLSGEQLPRIC